MRRLILIWVCAVLPVMGQAQEVCLSLEECRHMAMRNDVRVRNARLDVLSTHYLKQEAFTGYFPKVSFSSYGFMALEPLLEIGVRDILGEGEFAGQVQSVVDYLGAEYGFSGRFSALKSGFSASLTAIQPLYAGGRIVTGNRLAALGEKLSVLNGEMTMRDVLESVEKDYWAVVALEEKMSVLEASHVFLDNLYRDVSASVAAGLALDTDLMQVELKRNELGRMRISLTGGIRLAKMKLLDAIGQDYCLIPALADSLKPLLDAVVLSENIEGMPGPDELYVPEEVMLVGMSESKLLDLSVEEKRLRKRMALGEVLPEAGIGAAYGYSKAFGERFNGIVFAMLKIPLSDWGKVSHELRRLDNEMQKAQNDREHLRDMLLLQIRSLWQDLNVAWEEVALAREAMELAQKKSDRILDQYESGLVTLSDLLESRAHLHAAVDAMADAGMSYASAMTAYLSRNQ